jgi:hypothetical protein
LTEAPRSAATRKRDALALLATRAIDVWVATASVAGTAHLVPLSLAWVDERVVIAVSDTSVTAENLVANLRARLAVGSTRDVVMIVAVLERAVQVDQDDALWAAYVGQADWDPRQGSGYQFLVLRPERLQAWREANEIPGRTLVRDGRWLVADPD